jgi:glycosyltransferase involved in cell wall biosynthesis
MTYSLYVRIKKRKLITALILYYNDKDYISEAINSVLNQTVLPERIIVVDNGSTDSGLNFIASNTLIQIIRLEKNYPLGYARNSGLEIIKTPFVAFLDSDDVWERHKLETILPLLASEKIHYVHSNFIRIDDAGVSISKGLEAGLEGDCSRDHYRLDQITIGPPSSIVARTSSIRKVGGFENGYSISADWDLNQRISRKFPITYYPGVLVKYRVHQNNMSKNVDLYYEEMNKAILRNFQMFDIKKREYRHAKSKLHLIMAGEKFNRTDIQFVKHLILSLVLDFRLVLQRVSKWFGSDVK